MTLEEVMKEGNDKALQVRVKIPDNVEQLGSKQLKEGWIVMLHANGRGLFISPDPPGSGNRQLIAAYPQDRRDVLNWEVIPDAQLTEF
jgi:hypothetical protein